MEIPDNLMEYVNMLLEYNQKVNLISRQITHVELEQLLNETLLLNQYISNDILIDAGSGNGLLGLPLALTNRKKQIILIEPKLKKATFLQSVKVQLKLDHVDVQNTSVEEYLKLNRNVGRQSRTIIARGFPNLGAFCGFISQKLVNEAVIITSTNKIEKNLKQLESVRKKIYNIPLRTNLKVLKITG